MSGDKIYFGGAEIYVNSYQKGNISALYVTHLFPFSSKAYVEKTGTNNLIYDLKGFFEIDGDWQYIEPVYQTIFSEGKGQTLTLPGIDGMVRAVCKNCTFSKEANKVGIVNVSLTLAFATNSTVSNTQPLGLPGMVTSDNVINSKGVDFASVWATLNSAVAKIRGNNIYGPLVWIMSVETEFFLRSLLNSFGIPVFAQQMDEGHLWGIPYESTPLIPSNLANTASTPTDTVSPVYLYAPEYFVIADAGSFNVEQTNQGSFTTGSGTQINTFGQDLVAWKATTRLDSALTLDSALVQVLGDGWSFSNLASQVANVQTKSTSTSKASGLGQGS